MVETCFAPVLVGRDPCDINAAVAAMDAVVVGHSYAKCAVDIALHDLWGRIVGQPVYRLLGGACRPSVPVAHMVGLMPLDDAVAEATDAVADGIRALQIKGGEDPERDIALVTRLRREFGRDVALRLDANQGYRRVKTAIDVIRRLESVGLDYVEQPVEGLGDMAAVTAAVSTRVVADESCWDARDAMELIHRRAADCISIYLAKAGGFHGARAVATLAALADMPCDVNGSIESGVGNAANLHFALAAAPVEMPAVIPITAPAGRHPNRVAGNYYEDDIVRDPFRVRDGALLPLDGPGLGIEIDEEKLARFRC
jgi:muconate cycloisomerase